MKVKDRIEALLARIYPDRSEQESAARMLEALMERYASAFRGGVGGAGGARTRPTEKDVFLITYGNSLTDDGAQAPLAALRRFAEERLADFISYIHVLPFFPYSSDDGFSVIDYRTVNPSLGAWSDIEALGRGFKPAFDLVVNHASSKSAWFRGFLDGDPKYDRWFITRPDGFDWSKVVRPRTHPLFTPFVRADGRRVNVWTTFSADQVDLDFSNPAVLMEMLDIFLGYVRRGARIIRMDAIAYLWKEDGHSCLHHPRTHAIVRLFRAVVEALGADVLLLTETNVPHPENISYFGDGDEADMVYNFALPPLVVHSFAQGDVAELSAWAKTMNAPAGGMFLNFLASHDGIGLTPARELVDEKAFAGTLDRMKARGCLISYKSTASGEIPYELNASWFDAVSDLSLPEDLRIRAHLASHGIAACLDGMPAVYIHSLPGTPNWAEGPKTKGYNRAINRRVLDLKTLEAELADASSRAFRCLEGLRALYKNRARERALSPGAPSRVLSGAGSVFAVQRGDPRDCLVCAVNVGPEPAVLWLGPELLPRGHGYDPTKEERPEASAPGADRVLRLEPYGVLWQACGQP